VHAGGLFTCATLTHAHARPPCAPQVKASVYGYAGDLRDDKISAEEMAGIVGAAAARLDGDEKASLASLLRHK
jgi:hypothetical protein